MNDIVNITVEQSQTSTPVIVLGWFLLTIEFAVMVAAAYFIPQSRETGYTAGFIFLAVAAGLLFVTTFSPVMRMTAGGEKITLTAKQGYCIVTDDGCSIARNYESPTKDITIVNEATREAATVNLSKTDGTWDIG